MYNRKYYESLSRRVRVLEAMIIEGKRDQEILNNFLGDDYYNKYQAIKNKIRDPEYKDIYKIIKMDPDEVKSYIDSFQSNTDIRKSKKSEGAELIYQDNLWKVYRITTYKAARLYGSGTKWCITGRYDGHEERGEEYFNDYIEENDLDGGYYFYIKNDGKTKYCLLRKDNGAVHSIWDASDESLNTDDILVIENDFPSVDSVFTPPPISENSLFRNNSKIVFKAIKNGVDVNSKCTDKNSEYYGYTPLDWHMENNNIDLVDLLLSHGAKITNTFPWRKVFDWFTPSSFKKFWKHGLKNAIDINEMFEYAINHSGIDAIKTLLKLGADPNKPFSDGKSPLYHEITNQYGARVGEIKELYRYGADVTEILDNGDSLLDLAKKTPGANEKRILDLLEYLININKD